MVAGNGLLIRRPFGPLLVRAQPLEFFYFDLTFFQILYNSILFGRLAQLVRAADS